MNTSKKIQRKATIMTADMNGSTVMMDIQTGKYYNLGEIGGAIWALLEDAKTVDELVAALTREYNVTPEQCKTDTLPFLEQLLERGLVTEA